MLAAALVSVVAAVILERQGSGGDRTGSIHASYTVDVDNPRALAGASDDVFVGRVLERSGSGFFAASDPSPDSDLPFTLYRVEVLRSLKGPLSDVVEIVQMGGVDRTGATVLFDDDPLLAPGDVCLFATSGQYDPSAVATEETPAAGCPTLVNRFGDRRLETALERREVTAEFKDAVANQIAPDVRLKTEETGD